MELADDQDLYLQNIYDYFHINEQWPTYRHIERVLSQVRRNLDIDEISKSLPMGFATAFAFNHDLNAEAILSISAIHVCKGSEEDLADFIKMLQFCVERYFNAQEDNVQISSHDLRNHLNMSESSVRKMGLLLKDANEYPIWSTFGSKDSEGREWLCTLTRNIRYLDEVASIEQYLEKLHQLRATSVSYKIGRARPGVDTSMSHDQQNKSGESGNIDAEPLTTWEKMLNECQNIEEIVGKIQSSDNKGDLCTSLTSKEIDEVQLRYYLWYGDCLSILPDALKDKFRLAYEDDGSSVSVSISIFFGKSLEYKRSNGRVGYRGMRVYDTEWSYPYDTYFRNPLSRQKQILIEASKRKLIPHPATDAVEIIERLAKGFHAAVLQMRRRHDHRQSFVEVNDEYDVQDLFHALLIPFFEDIRREDYAPSLAGSPSRIDFLLKREQIGIEIKKTREGLKSKQLGEELIIDMKRYRSHTDFKTFIAFVYDPDRLINNPKELEDDLSGVTEGVFVKVIVAQR